MVTWSFSKIFYFDRDTENLLDEPDAETASLEEVLDEIFELNDDNESYVGIIKTDKTKYKVKSDAYDSYLIYRAEADEEYVLVELGNWEKCREYITSVY